MQIAERNRLIKKVLTNAFGAGKVTVRGSRGTAYGWVSVNIDARPKDREHRDALIANVWALFAKHNIKIGSYDSADYGSGNKIHLDFGLCLDQFEVGERVTWASGGKIGTIIEPNYRNPQWYIVQWDGADKPEEFYKNDLSRIAPAEIAA
jgi:hypothetical protein